jgi:hypothetical protein
VRASFPELRILDAERAIPLLAVLMDVLWVYPWFVWIGEWDVLGWMEPPLALGSALSLPLAAAAMSLHSLVRNWTPCRTSLLVLPILFFLLAAVLRLDMSGGYALWDTEWIQNALKHPSPFLGGLVLGIFLLWRGISNGRDMPSFDGLYRRFLMGLTALVLLLVIRSSTIGASEVLASTGYYVLGFFSVGLLSLGLVNLQSIGKEMLHREGASGVLDRRWFPMLLGLVFIILAVSLITASIFSLSLATSLLRPLGALATWLVTAIVFTVALPLAFVAAGLTYVLRFLVSFIGRGEPPETFSPPGPEEMRRVVEGQDASHISPEALLALKVIVGVLLVLLVLFILWRTLRRYWSAREEGDGIEQVSESLWSWDGFKSDVRSFLSRLISNFDRRKHATPDTAPFPAALGGVEDTDRVFTVQEIYQGLLREGHIAGLPRRQPETPYEYQGRLQANFPPGRPEIQAITEAYAAQRYGHVDATGEQLSMLNHLWRRLLQVLRFVATDANHG